MSGSQDKSQPISRHRTVLLPADHAALFAALDQPPPPTGKLTAAIKRHRQTVESR